jgi:hypothetical protein
MSVIVNGQKLLGSILKEAYENYWEAMGREKLSVHVFPFTILRGNHLVGSLNVFGKLLI